MERLYMGEQMSLQLQNEVLKVPTAVNFSDHLIENKNSTNRCKGVIQVLSNEQQEVFRKTLSLANVIAISSGLLERLSFGPAHKVVNFAWMQWMHTWHHSIEASCGMNNFQLV